MGAAVVNHLSDQQRRRSNIASLASLDLAALLRILDQNWYQLTTKLHLPSEARHFVKEMQTIRNRWAHSGTEGFSVDDIYRDLDTLQRFASTINADESLLREVRAAKTGLLAKDMAISGCSIAGKQAPEPKLKEPTAEFEPGQIVFLKSNPTIKGAIVSVMTGTPENRFKVFINGDTQTYYATQLKGEDRQDDNATIVTSEQFHAYLTSLQIRYPGLSTLYSLNAARVDFIPYQFRPVLRFIRADRPRLLIADGVGVGKTIEAGLILRELQARRDIRSVLIICPRPLVTEKKWQSEMKRFEERFTHLDGPTLRFCINEMDLDGMWPEQHRRAIVPYSLFDEALLYGSGPDSGRKRKKGLLDLDHHHVLIL